MCFLRMKVNIVKSARESDVNLVPDVCIDEERLWLWTHLRLVCAQGQGVCVSKHMGLVGLDNMILKAWISLGFDDWVWNFVF